MVEESENCENIANRIDDIESHATNSSGEGLPPSNAIHARKELKGCSTTNCTSTGGRKENQTFGNSTFQPILPWINGDGTINGIVHRGLTRRILGIVCQNPGILEVLIIPMSATFCRGGDLKFRVRPRCMNLNFSRP